MSHVTGMNASRTSLSGHTPSPSQVTVHKGDTLSGIAARHGISLGALERANPAIAGQRFIFPGDKLTIPASGQAAAQHTASHTIQRGETLSSIAAKHGTSVSAIAAANPGTIKNVNHIYPGDTIVIPGGEHPTAPQSGGSTSTARTIQNQPITQIASRGVSDTGILQPGRASLRAADIAEQRAAGRPSIGKCYAWVKDALLASGATSRRLDGVPAKAAGAELRSQGYVNVLGQPGYNIRSPYDASKGAVLVYGAAPGATDNNAKYGHIEIRTQNGFASDYFSKTARTGVASNGLSSASGANKPRVLIGVYVKADAGTQSVINNTQTRTSASSLASGSQGRLTEVDFVRAAKTLGVDVATIKAVAEVESRGNGFLPDGRLAILFERHKFSGFTSRVFDASYPGISNRNAGGYGKGGANQYVRLSEAMSLDETAALKSASWGKFQIMGFNHKALGYSTVQAFVADMKHSEGRQLDAFVKFVEVNGLAKHLRSHNWAAFAAGYNGRDYAINQYDTKLAAQYARFSNRW